MNVQDGRGAIHYMVDETQRLLCGHQETGVDWPTRRADAPITCPACVRLLADDVRGAGPRTDDPED